MSDNIIIDNPTLQPIRTIPPFRFWVQQVLPSVYDDSLSYSELLNKVVTYLNDVITVTNQNTDNVNTLDAYVIETKNTLVDAFNTLQSFVDDYFDNLDVQEEINNKLDAMALDGTLDTLIAPFVPAAVTAWLNEHVVVSDETTVVIDDSLEVEDAAAESSIVGKKLIFGETSRLAGRSLASLYGGAVMGANLDPDPTEFSGIPSNSWFLVNTSNFANTGMGKANLPSDCVGSSLIFRYKTNFGGDTYLVYLTNSRAWCRGVKAVNDTEITWRKMYLSFDDANYTSQSDTVSAHSIGEKLLFGESGWLAGRTIANLHGGAVMGADLASSPSDFSGIPQNTWYLMNTSSMSDTGMGKANLPTGYTGSSLIFRYKTSTGGDAFFVYLTNSKNWCRGTRASSATEITWYKMNTVVDNTLSVSGNAADAGAVGTQITTINSSISTINSNIKSGKIPIMMENILPSLTPANGYTDGSDVFHSSNTWREYTVEYDPRYNYYFSFRGVLNLYFGTTLTYHESGNVNQKDRWLTWLRPTTSFKLAINQIYANSFIIGKVLKPQNSNWWGRRALFIGDSVLAGRSVDAQGNVYLVDKPFGEMACESLGIICDSGRNVAVGGATVGKPLHPTSGTTESWTNTLFNQISSSTYNIRPENNQNWPSADKISSYGAELIVLRGGGNDWAHETPIGTKAGMMSEGLYTFWGGLWYTVDTILRSRPNATIVYVTNLKRGSTLAETMAENQLDLTLDDYNNVIKEFCEIMNIPVCDMWSDAMLNPVYQTDYFSTRDHLHPTQLGHTRMARLLADTIDRHVNKIDSPTW